MDMDDMNALNTCKENELWPLIIKIYINNIKKSDINLFELYI